VISKLRLSAAVGGAIALTVVAGTGVAATFSQSADALLQATATLSSVEQMHGCHRSCRLGRVPRWGGIVRLHRHVGSCRPVRC
jgi:hypothetical protein